MKTGTLQHVVALMACIAMPVAAATASNAVIRAEDALEAWRMDEVGVLLHQLPDTAEGNYVRGIAANRANDIEASKRALLLALPELERKDPKRAAEALMTLADDYRKTSSFADEAETLRRALRIKPDDVKADLAIADALSAAPPQTVSFSGTSTLPISRNVLGTFNVEAVANGVAGPWMLDTGANLSIVSDSFAKRLGLEVTGAVPGVVGSATGTKVDTRVATVKEIRLGSATLHDVVVLVVSDELLHIKLPNAEYQISAALGYPVFQALGQLSIHGEKEIEVGAETSAIVDGTPLYMDGLTPVVMLGVEGEMLPFTLDTGATVTSLSDRYWTKIKGRASKWPHAMSRSSGLGGAKAFDTVTQPEWKVRVGKDEVVLKDIKIEVAPRAGESHRPMFGNLGQDLWRDASGFTIDFRAMRFRIIKAATHSEGT